ncbi:hypothetical protein THAOC_15591 [Thalassiosira oceanica]|uniref:Uncharacterized protein n=1 Tax=Thalassiosira oceanica TaxID=159749 RepID=K0SFI7_THAOC|nr:hypothetical protein THAOC_15591 [Thalassiosira oceanica]|eukprot:EJK63734.1 hypothetical protein THAOC_15591 [Thalassiosira oceanica]
MPDGPSASYDPDGDGEGGDDGRAGVKGSSNAYNLFYVERGYLAKQVRAALEGDAASLYGGVLADIDSRRDERYKAEREVARRTDYRRSVERSQCERKICR